MIGIRVDANEHIASGHVMRCLSIASAFFDLGETVLFFTSDPFAEEMIAKHGFEVICLKSDWDNKDEELGLLVPYIKDANLDILLVDSYQVTEHYLSELRSVVKVAYLDDLNSFDYPVDIVINYSICAEELRYPPNKMYLLGMKYVPLRNQFDISDEDIRRAITTVREEYKQVLITTGATDPYHVAEMVVREVLKRPELDKYRLALVKGRFWDTDAFDKSSIDSLVKYAGDRIIVYENVENMAELMMKSRFAVSAGGSTLYELCACCVPTVVFSHADNQIDDAVRFAQRGIMLYPGDARYNEDIASKVLRALLKYHENSDIMDNAIIKMTDLHCGKGARNLAQGIHNYIINIR